jgi:hypothetical protein
MLRIKFVKLTLFLITLFFFTSCATKVAPPVEPPSEPPPKSDTSSPVVKVSGYTFYSASATSNVFVLKEVTSEFSKGDIVTFGDSKEEYEIREAKVLRKIAMPDNTWVVLYHGSKFKISPGSGNIQGIVLKKAVGFEISPGIKVSVHQPSDTSSPVVKVSGYTFYSASATSNVFVLKEVTSEFSKGDIVTFGDSKKEYEIREAKVLRKIAMPDNTWVVLYHGSKFKISPGSGNIQGIVIKGAVGFKISPGMKVSVVVQEKSVVVQEKKKGVLSESQINYLLFLGVCPRQLHDRNHRDHLSLTKSHKHSGSTHTHTPERC